MNVYRVRATSVTSKRGRRYFSIALPREIGERLEGRRFRFQMTDEGILYVPVVEDESEPDLPAWAQS